MSKEIIFRCNRCGKIISGDHTYRLVAEKIDKDSEDFSDSDFFSEINNDKDFCQECLNAITKYALRRPGMTINPEFEKAVQEMVESDKAIPIVTEAIPTLPKAIPTVTEAIPTLPEAIPTVQKIVPTTPDLTPESTEEEKIKRQIYEIDMPSENKYPAKKNSRKKLTEEQCIKAEDMYKKGTKVQVIADTLGATYINVYDHLKSCGLKKKTTPSNIKS